MATRRRQKSLEVRKAEHAEITDPSLVLEACLRFLEARARSAAEVRRRLLLHGYRADLVEGAIERLTELGMIDDAAFAKAWVESRDRARPRGERALRQELRIKGVDRAVIDEVIVAREGASTERDPEGAVDMDHLDDPSTADDSAAHRLLARHARALERIVDPGARRQRAYALLARNGFSPEISSRLAAATVVAVLDAADEGQAEAAP